MLVSLCWNLKTQSKCRKLYCFNVLYCFNIHYNRRDISKKGMKIRLPKGTNATNAFAGKWKRSARQPSAGVAPEVNLREHVTLFVCLRQVQIRQNPLRLWNPEEMSPEVQNRGISGPTKRTHVLQKLKKKKDYQQAGLLNANMFHTIISDYENPRIIQSPTIKGFYYIGRKKITALVMTSFF